MILPEYIRISLESKINKYKLSDILEVREDLTYKYKNNEKYDKIINSEKQVIAYILSRLPATFSVVSNILKKHDLSSCKSLLDLGSGPGTVIFSCLEQLELLEKITYVEHEYFFIKQFKEIISSSNNDILKNTTIFSKDVLDIDSISNHDLITCSYVLNELKPDKQDLLINKLWNKSNQFIILIEPGTPVGFKNILKAREKLIELGGFIVAPCPHNNKCPLESNDWCHFSQRVERSSYQKYLKNAQESYEDEKFSYIIVSKDFIDSSLNERIIRHPQIHKGHIDFKLCSNDGLKEITISKKDDNYKKSKKKVWGDSI